MATGYQETAEELTKERDQALHERDAARSLLQDTQEALRQATLALETARAALRPLFEGCLRGELTIRSLWRRMAALLGEEGV